jgi:hypothetical protein
MTVLVPLVTVVVGVGVEADWFLLSVFDVDVGVLAKLLVVLGRAVVGVVDGCKRISVDEVGRFQADESVNFARDRAAMAPSTYLAVVL